MREGNADLDSAEYQTLYESPADGAMPTGMGVYIGANPAKVRITSDSRADMLHDPNGEGVELPADARLEFAAYYVEGVRRGGIKKLEAAMGSLGATTIAWTPLVVGIG